MAIAKRLLFIPIILLAIAAGYWWGVYSTENPSTPSPTQNRLSRELSPYLRLHAHNPVDWYPWGEEALAKARQEDKPIFLSVGYSSCYWCHVMERLVFSDPDIAHLMNQFFVNIKVDREERPDIDEIYMTATQLMTGHGGWPNSVFLTPDLKPFLPVRTFPRRFAWTSGLSARDSSTACCLAGKEAGTRKAGRSDIAIHRAHSHDRHRFRESGRRPDWQGD